MPKQLTPEELAAFDAAPGLTPEQLAAFDALPAPGPEGQTPAAPEAEDNNALAPDTTLGAAARGFAQGGTFGFADEAGGVLGAVDELARRALGSGGVYGDKPLKQALVERYLLERNANRRELAQAERARPVTTGAAALLGGLALPIPGAGAVKAAAQAGKVGQAALRAAAVGAGAGALTGLGTTEDYTAGDFALPAAIGAAGGAGTIAAVPVLARAAEGWAAKGLGVRPGIKNALRKMNITSDEEVRQLGRQALDEKLLPFPFTKGAVAEAAEDLGDRAGQEIGTIIDMADNSGRALDYSKLQQAAKDAADEVGKSAYSKATQYGPAQDFIDAIPEQAALTPGSFKGGRVLKSEAQAGVNWADKSTQQKQIQKEAVRGYTREFLDQVGKAVGPRELANLKDANRRFGLAENVYELATEAGTRESAHRVFGLTGLILGGGAAAAGSPATGMALGATENIMRRMGPAAAARAMDAGSKFLEKYGHHFARVTSPATVAVTDYVLANRADGEQYRKDKEELAKAMAGKESAP